MNIHLQNRIRVAYLIDTLDRGTAGTEKQLLRTIEKLDRKKFKPYLVCLWRSSWMDRNQLPCPVKVLGYRGFIKSNISCVFSELKRFVSEEDIRIVHVFFMDSIFVAFFTWRNEKELPILISSRRDIGLGNEPWYHAAYDLLLPFVNRRFKAVVANSRNVGRHVIEKERLKTEKVRIIYNGIDIERDSPASIPGGTSKGKVVRIALLANLKVVKRIDIFLEAFRILRRTVNGIRIEGLILGDGPEREKLKAMAIRLGIEKDVLFAGEVSDVFFHLRKMDIGVLTSDREGLSNAILEYMACGLPVVATAVGGTPELIDCDNGICVPPGDPGALAEAIRRLVSAPELRQSMGLRSLEKAKSQFSWERTISDLQSLYTELCPGSTE